MWRTTKHKQITYSTLLLALRTPPSTLGGRVGREAVPLGGGSVVHQRTLVFFAVLTSAVTVHFADRGQCPSLVGRVLVQVSQPLCQGQWKG